jgi:hypothetical protein
MIYRIKLSHKEISIIKDGLNRLLHPDEEHLLIWTNETLIDLKRKFEELASLKKEIEK